MGNALRCGEPWTQGSARRATGPGLSSIAAMYVWQRTAPALAVALLYSAQRRDGVAGRIQEVSTTIRVVRPGLSTVHA